MFPITTVRYLAMARRCSQMFAGFVERIAKGDVLVGPDAAKRLVGAPPVT